MILIMNFGIENLKYAVIHIWKDMHFTILFQAIYLFHCLFQYIQEHRCKPYTKITYINCALNSGRSRISKKEVTISKGTNLLFGQNFQENAWQWCKFNSVECMSKSCLYRAVIGVGLLHCDIYNDFWYSKFEICSHQHMEGYIFAIKFAAVYLFHSLFQCIQEYRYKSIH